MYFSKALACKSGHEFEMYYQTRDRGKQYKLVLKLLSETYFCMYIITCMLMKVQWSTLLQAWVQIHYYFVIFKWVF